MKRVLNKHRVGIAFSGTCEVWQLDLPTRLRLRGHLAERPQCVTVVLVLLKNLSERVWRWVLLGLRIDVEALVRPTPLQHFVQVKCNFHGRRACLAVDDDSKREPFHVPFSPHLDGINEHVVASVQLLDVKEPDLVLLAN